VGQIFFQEVLKKLSLARLPQKAFDGCYSIESIKRNKRGDSYNINRNRAKPYCA